MLTGKSWDGHCPFCLVEKRIWRSLNSDILLDAPVNIQRSLELFAKHFRSGRQEDAHEFLRYLIEACNDVCAKLYKARNIQGGKASKGEPDTIVKDIKARGIQPAISCLLQSLVFVFIFRSKDNINKTSLQPALLL